MSKPRNIQVRPVEEIVANLHEILHEQPELRIVQLAGLDSAIIGIAQVQGQPVLIYSVPLIITALRHQNGWSFDDAREWFDTNVQAGYGEGTPIFME